MFQRGALIGAVLNVAACSSVGDCNCGGSTSPPMPAIVPGEVADEEALAPLTDWLALPTFGDGRYAHQSSEDRRTGAPVEMPLWDHDNRDFNNFICRGAKADAPDSKVPFVFDLPACPETHVEGLVMARFEGSGRLSRMWFTALSIRNAPPDEELVRIYVDDDTAPHIEVPLAEMLGSGTEIFAPPFGAGSSRYVAWYYPVVFSKKLIVSIDRTGTEDLYFYQTDVVLDREPRARSAPANRLGRRDDALKLLGGEMPTAATTRATEVTLAAGESQTVELTGPATIVSAKLRLAKEQLAALASVRVLVAWDDQPGPAIDLSLADLYAAWENPVERSSLALSANDHGTDVELGLALPMPFEKKASWRFENSTEEPVTFALTLGLADRMPRGTWGRLHTQRYETAKRAPQPTHPIAHAEGRGRLVGVCADLRGHGLIERGKPGHPFHFLEGDETITIDGERRVGGTGTEDYFNGAFYFEDGANATPFAQVWNVTPHLPSTTAGAPRRGRASSCRWHVLGDAIDFASSLDMTLEIGPGVPDVIDRYVTVAYLYR